MEDRRIRGQQDSRTRGLDNWTEGDILNQQTQCLAYVINIMDTHGTITNLSKLTNTKLVQKVRDTKVLGFLYSEDGFTHLY